MSSNKDFQDFISTDDNKAPEAITNLLRDKIHTELNPSHQVVFFKLLLAQGFVGVLTLLLCPQFELSLTNNHDLFHFFHHTFGVELCMAVCATLFMGSGAIFASYALSTEELNKIKNNEYLYYFSLTLIAVTAFFFAGGSFEPNLLVYWVLGSFISGLALFELNRMIRFKIIQAL